MLKKHQFLPPRRLGMTLIELIIAMTVMTMIVGSLAVMSDLVNESGKFSTGYLNATQHARVVFQRIGRTVREAKANEQFPGALVVDATVGGWSFPDTLVVWSPESLAVDPDGLPLTSELVVYCTRRSAPNELLEITSRNDLTPVPPPSDLAAWRTFLEAMKLNPNSRITVLTPFLRTASASDASTGNVSRTSGCVRFVQEIHPSQAEWDNYQNGVVAWEDLSWAQSIYGSSKGLRQTWIRIELQLEATTDQGTPPQENLPAAPFFGSAALYYLMDKS